WNNISWASNAIGELPDNKEIETKFVNGNADMSGNVLLMHMNELSGTIVDSSGTGNNGTASGVTYGVVGKIGSALSFDGVNDYVSMGVNALAPDLAGCSGVTISAWINPSSLDNGSTNRDNIADILINSSGTTHSSAAYLTLRYGGNIWFGGRSQPGETFQSVETIQTVNVGAWQHVVGVLDFPNDKIYIYYNGVKVGQGNVSFGQDNLVVGTPTSNDVIGANPTLNTHFFAGKIDEFAVWNRSLSEDEIVDVYKRGALSLDVSVRSCDDGSCDGEGWIDIDDISPQNLHIFNDRYFQYRFDFKTDDLSFSPELYNVTVCYENIPESDYNFTYLINETETKTYGYLKCIKTNISFNNTIYALMLKPTFSSGSYISRIFDTELFSSWNNISWASNAIGELPDNKEIETKFV
ncbi:MAG: LamG domain-containing protein, partial [Candidatus Thermoplasmatota archaeon]|nr:LamG domain-containing protein [Candidatus Thermoplasmatota archaeon]